ncbi:hypothetical protein DFH06DRAFT_1104662 [Mycena polygramma]|nr:hypothetical protein DFH06DRAFT_1104662 [Mycena polygramma]
MVASLHFTSFTCFIFFLVCQVHGHLDARNAPGVVPVTEIPLPALPTTLVPQAAEYNFDLQAALPPASSTLSPLSILPSDCALYVGGTESECPSSMAATAVTYEDCGDAFIVCRCDNANMTMDTIVDRLARVPVGLRRFIGTVLALGSNVTEAYTDLSTGDIHSFGDCAMDTWIHEATHTFDYATPNMPSNSTGWKQAITEDSCVPDPYSLENRVEDFAQMSVMKVYMLLHSGYLPPGFSADCMSHQLDFMATLPLYNATSLFGNTCAIKDGSSYVRHSEPPSVLDPTRGFETVSLDPTPTAVAQTAAPHNSASHSNQCHRLVFYVLLFLSNAWHGLLR